MADLGRWVWTNSLCPRCFNLPMLPEDLPCAAVALARCIYFTFVITCALLPSGVVLDQQHAPVPPGTGFHGFIWCLFAQAGALVAQPLNPHPILCQTCLRTRVALSRYQNSKPSPHLTGFPATRKDAADTDTVAALRCILVRAGAQEQIGDEESRKQDGAGLDFRLVWRCFE